MSCNLKCQKCGAKYGKDYGAPYCPSCESKTVFVDLQDKDPTRVRVLKNGITLTTGDRNKSYGDPYPNLKTFAHLVNCYLKGLGWTGPKLEADDGAMIMVLAKVSRVTVNKHHEDNAIDGSTYFAIFQECVEKLMEERNGVR